MKSSSKYLSKAHAGMSILGWLHYVLGLFSLLMAGFCMFMGPALFGAQYRTVCPPILSFLLALSDVVLGWGVVFAFLIRTLTEIYLGWSWRRKARKPANHTLTLLISGGKVLYVLFSLLIGGLQIAVQINCFSLALNSVTFLLALTVSLRQRQPDQQVETGGKPGVRRR